MDSTQDGVRGRLEAERERLQTEVESLRRRSSSDVYQDDEGTDTVSQHPADEGSEMFEREKDLTLIDTLQVSLRQVEDALQRVDSGQYGICANCGKPIGEKRLEALPAAIYCIDCQSILDRVGHF
jgi:RNA polymerase-binding protein DksA